MVIGTGGVDEKARGRVSSARSAEGKWRVAAFSLADRDDRWPVVDMLFTIRHRWLQRSNSSPVGGSWSSHVAMETTPDAAPATSWNDTLDATSSDDDLAVLNEGKVLKPSIVSADRYSPPILVVNSHGRDRLDANCV